MANCIDVSSAQERDTDDPLKRLIESTPALAAVAASAQHEVQVLYTQIDRDIDNAPSFRSYSWNLDRKRYFYPASTVKLPAAVLALEKIEQLGVSNLSRGSAMQTRVLQGEEQLQEPIPPTTLERCIREIFLVSSNPANNRLFEFVGPKELSDGLQSRGYRGSRIFHRLSVRRTPGAVRTNRIDFFDQQGAPIHTVDERSFKNEWISPEAIPRGVAHIVEGKKVEEPKDFASLNFFPLEDQQKMLRALVFPNSIPEGERFHLSDEGRQFLLTEMSRWVSESPDPSYDPDRYPDTYTKLLFFGFAAKRESDPDIRMFSKSGMAYGTLTDNAYFVDYDNRVEYFLSATVFVNANQTYNDDIYEYDTIGIPFMRELGRVVHQHELKRPRADAHMPRIPRLRYREQ